MTVSVPGSANPYLAGMPPGSTCCAADDGVPDSAPAQSPVQVFGLTLTPGTVLTFTVSGSVSFSGGSPTDPPDGSVFNTLDTFGLDGTPSSNGIAGMLAPQDALVGLFLDDSVPTSSTAPPRLDFSSAGLGMSFARLAPGLKQPFFIGDGRTGNGTGAVQQFVVPAGATRFFLGTVDGVQWHNNTGSLNVQVTSTVGGGPTAANHDFNGDSKSDILWRHASGVVDEWFLNGTSVIGTGSPGSASPDWTIAGVGDFNGDGKADILWRHSSGAVYIWLLNGTNIIGTGSPGSVGTDWTIAGVGDFNGDGKADILWRHASGALDIWLMNGTTVGSTGSPGTVSTDWSIVGVGDFNGDGKADVLWRHTSGALDIWLMNGTTVGSTGSPGTVSTDWSIAGVGDFNGDGKADILWRHSSGIVYLWLMNGTSVTGTGSPGSAGTDWTIQGVGDFNGDGMADVLWRHTSGAVFIWLMNGTGISGTGSPGTVDTSWAIQ
ncbi:MAG TPA: VCBS repeat-containing protein [Candidatus Methylomirabilis sp.]|nr:VCBS repeat-containing protein [Candidatus Methylomirabilis sp.]